MKIVGNFLFWFFVFLIAGNLILGALTYGSSLSLNNLSSITSPIPKLLSAFSNTNKNDSYWKPKLVSRASAQAQLELTAVSAMAYDTTTESLLYSKQTELKLPIASLTKIMTAVIALENLNLKDEVIVTKSAATIGEGTMGLSTGEKLTVEELLYGLLLQSGNDAGETLAQTSEFGREGYIHLMNKKAEDLGLSNTRFTNPSGLQGDGEQYSTVSELVILTNYAMQNPTFRKIVATYNHKIPATKLHKEFNLFNETNLLTTYPGVRGVKTGFTDEAGMCLVSYLDYNGHQIIAVLLNSQNRREEMASLLDYSLQELGIEPPKRN